MPIQPTYKTGTVTVASGSAAVTGAGTAFALALVNGGVLSFKGFSIPIAAVADDTHLTLDYPAPAGMAGTGAYSIILGRADAASAIVANRQLADLVAILAQKISAFGATLIDDADAGAALTTLGVSAFAKTILDDADASAARATFGAPGLDDLNVFTADINTFGRDASNGYVRLRRGNATLPGYIEFRDKANARWGYLGGGTVPNTLTLLTDAGYSLRIESATLIAGALDVADGNQVGFGTFSNVGASFGVRWDSGYTMLCSGTGTAARNVVRIFNGNGQVGAIQSNGAATAFLTSSDETLKDFAGEMSFEDAVAVISADPVRRFVWKQSGEAAIGWGAQTSYAISPDLASPGHGWIHDETGEPAEPEAEGASYQPWGMDHGRRTPYLWAAVAGLLRQVEALAASVAALEGREAAKRGA